MTIQELEREVKNQIERIPKERLADVLTMLQQIGNKHQDDEERKRAKIDQFKKSFRAIVGSGIDMSDYKPGKRDDLYKEV